MKFSTALTLLSTATGVLATKAMPTTAAEAMMGETTTAAAMMGETTPMMEEMATATEAAMMGMTTEAAMMGTTEAAMMEMSTEAMMGMTTEAAMMGTTEAAMMDTTAGAAMTTEAAMMETSAAMMAGETTSAAAAAAMTHTVMVGGDAGLVYTPNQVTAAVGDVVHFVMLAKNHTVTQSTFANPCVKMAGGQDSGFLPNAGVSAAEAPTFQVTVASTDPTWWYCKQKVGTHCGKGMVFAINPTAEKSFEAFQSMAIAQNGTGAAASTTAAAAASGTVTLTVDNGNSMAATTTAAGAIATTTSIAAGWNNAGNAQACNCACFCGVAAFPVGAGLGAFGGFSGSLPAPWSA